MESIKSRKRKSSNNYQHFKLYWRKAIKNGGKLTIYHQIKIIMEINKAKSIEKFDYFRQSSTTLKIISIYL